MLISRQKLLYLSFCALVSAVLLLSGCLQGSIEYAPVKGRITLDGEPVPDAKIMFIPTKQRNEKRISLPYSFGFTDKDGNYTLKTEKQQKGAVVGSHIVIISTAYAPKEKTAEKTADGDNTKEETKEKDAETQSDDKQPEPPAENENSTDEKSKPETIPPRYNIRSELMFEVKRGTGNQADFRLSTKRKLD